MFDDFLKWRRVSCGTASYGGQSYVLIDPPAPCGSDGRCSARAIRCGDRPDALGIVPTCRLFWDGEPGSLASGLLPADDFPTCYRPTLRRKRGVSA